MDHHGNRAARREERGDQGDPRVRKVSDGVTSREEGKTKKGGRNRERRKEEERREEKGEDEGDGKSKGEASNRVGRNDRLGCGREEMDAREWRGGQKVGSNQDQSGFLDQEV